MTDVRLTATNPEDASVVPVACNAKGELKLEEPISFDGNLDGDLTVSGAITSAQYINAGGQPNTSETYGVELEPEGRIDVRREASGDITFASFPKTSVTPSFFVRGDGSFESASSFYCTDKKVGFTADGELLFFSRGVRYRAVFQGGNVMAEEYSIGRQAEEGKK